MHTDKEINSHSMGKKKFPAHKEPSGKAETAVGIKYGHAAKMTKEPEPKVKEGKHTKASSDYKYHTHKTPTKEESKGEE